LTGTKRLQGSAAVGIALVLGALLASPTVAAGGAASHFAPTVGDWEGTLHGLRASFQLVRYPHGKAFGASGYAIQDLVYQSPATCPASLTDPTLSTFVAYADAPPPFVLIGNNGRFPFGTSPLAGAFSGQTRASLNEPYTAAAGRSKCSGTLHFSLSPAHRLPAADGTWRLTDQDGSGGTFTVRGAGRIAFGVPLANVTAQCSPSSGTIPGSFSGRAAMFIRPSGASSETVSGNGATLAVRLRFVTATTASGTFTASATGCTPVTLAFTAARTSS
jgi:hypothetical protein